MTDRNDHHHAEAEDVLGSGPPELGIGLDAEGTSGTGEGEDPSDTALDYDFDERRIDEDA